LMLYYKMFPGVLLQRALEVEESIAVRNLCAPPILDLGCGDGLIARLVFGYPVDAGIDTNIQSLRAASDTRAYQVAVGADAKNLPFKEKFFGSVYCNSAMEHMQGLNAVLEELARVLKIKGILVTLVPSRRLLKPIGLIGRLIGQGIWDRFNRLQNHINLFDENEWRSILSRHGFKTRLIKAYCNYAIARYIFWLDFFGKLHFNFRWPFLHLRHCGNLGFIVTKIILWFLDLRRILSKYAYRDDINYCLMIMAVKE